MRLYDGDTFEHKGFAFKYEVRIDEDMGEPWKEHDGHGVISEWRHVDTKRPGEVIISRDRNMCRFYDVQESQRIAFKDRWGCETAELQARLKRQPTRKEIAAEAVRLDYERMKDWCEDQWHWCGVIVTMLDANEEPTEFTESLWGIDGDDQTEYLSAEALTLADECIEQWRKHGAEVNV